MFSLCCCLLLYMEALPKNTLCQAWAAQLGTLAGCLDGASVSAGYLKALNSMTLSFVCCLKLASLHCVVWVLSFMTVCCLLSLSATHYLAFTSFLVVYLINSFIQNKKKKHGQIHHHSMDLIDPAYCSVGEPWRHDVKWYEPVTSQILIRLICNSQRRKRSLWEKVVRELLPGKMFSTWVVPSTLKWMYSRPLLGTQTS